MSFSHTTNAHPAYIENLYRQYKTDAASIDGSWAQFFSGFEYATQNLNGDLNSANGDPNATAPQLSTKEFQVLDLIQAYRHRAHLLSDTNPIRPRKDRKADLALSLFGLSDADMQTAFVAGNELGLGTATLAQILDKLNNIYCGHIGFEFSYIENSERRNWLQSRIEAHNSTNYNFTKDQKDRILFKLNQAVGFEKFLDKKYGATKRFSLEGGDTTIPAIDAMINRAAEHGVEEVVIGMAHRGRLNVLTNILGKTYKQLLGEFEGKSTANKETMGSGDVKYHLGYSSQVTTPEGHSVYLKLMPNPSHLECVNAVVEGFTRAKLDIEYGGDVRKVLPILLHGDAALAGQGIVYETVQMSQLEGYHTGGTVHIVTNNQIGFTTDFEDARSSYYCTSIASLVEAPVFHVNGDDPEAVAFAVRLAADYRHAFHSDVFIDIVCYRKWGHNEGEDANFTNGKMFKHIRANYKDIKDYYEDNNPFELYSKRLVANGSVPQATVDAMKAELDAKLQMDLQDIKEDKLDYTYQEAEHAWRDLKKQRPQGATAADLASSIATGFDKKEIERILAHLQTLPKDFKLYDKVERLLKGLKKTIEADALDWGTAELLAYATLMLEGKDVRMSGQDVKRGTFSHRQCVFFDTDEEQQYNRIATLADTKGKFRIYNSLLSEFAVMGFEYGYSLATPNSLVLWEGQFGDFYNGAQTIVDQFITSGETKWGRMSGLVLLLPHGMEGQGPEHSSGRIERFLQQCAEDNMTVANVSTPANLFHILRRQMERPFRKPLILFTPKSLLRHPLCVSKVSDFAEGTHFQEVMDDAKFDTKSSKSVKKLVLCCGKIYYELLEKQTADNRNDIALARLEQFYPFPQAQVDALVAKYPKAELVWVQEEAENMGAARHLQSTFRTDLNIIARPSAAAPAVGYKVRHDAEQAEIIAKVFG
jgi:2-oxoglutarate dehydrogenase E1 component